MKPNPWAIYEQFAKAFASRLTREDVDDAVGDARAAFFSLTDVDKQDTAIVRVFIETEIRRSVQRQTYGPPFESLADHGEQATAVETPEQILIAAERQSGPFFELLYQIDAEADDERRSLLAVEFQNLIRLVLQVDENEWRILRAENVEKAWLHHQGLTGTQRDCNLFHQWRGRLLQKLKEISGGGLDALLRLLRRIGDL